MRVIKVFFFSLIAALLVAAIAGGIAIWFLVGRPVRRMTAAVGLPTLRLIRYSVGDWTIDGLAPGQWKKAP